MASVTFSFDVNYDSIVPNTSTKEQLEKIIEEKLATVMQVDISMILNVTISKGSILVNFVILAPAESKRRQILCLSGCHKTITLGVLHYNGNKFLRKTLF